MKSLIKIVIGILVLVACANATRAAFSDYQFKDAVHEALLFDTRATPEEVVDTVMKLAAEYEIPLNAEDVSARMVGQDMRVDMTYTTNVVLVPGVFSRDWTFSPSTSVRRLAGTGR
ncbi:MAG TPA: hypothetical protein VNT81_08410 [Vicinamibacterales bacterium]|nr:hypothetical protein [Vicinamibacterales bacterium]